MAKFTFKLNDVGGIHFPVEADSQEAAIAQLEAMSPEEIRAMVQKRMGLSDEDLSAIEGGRGHVARADTTRLRLPFTDISTPSFGVGENVGEFLTGAGHELANVESGLVNLVDPNKERVAQRQRDTRNANETFETFDAQGFGAEDLGQFGAQAAMFLGGGDAKFGFQLLNYGIRGAGYGAATNSAEGKDAARGAIIGGLTGLATTTTAAGLAKVLKLGGESLFNVMGMLVSASKKNGMGLAISGAHLMRTLSRGKQGVVNEVRAARLAGQPVDQATAVAASVSSNLVRNLQRVIGQLRGQDVDQFVVTTTRQALKESMDPNTGFINPRKLYLAIGEFRPSELVAMGPAGKELLRIRNAVGAIADMGSNRWQRKEIQQAIGAVVENPEQTRALTLGLLNAGRPGTREQIVSAIARVADTATAAAGNSQVQNAVQTMGIGQ